MPTKRKEFHCRYCTKKIVPDGTLTSWVHVDTGKSHSSTPFDHNAIAWHSKTALEELRRKQGEAR